MIARAPIRTPPQFLGTPALRFHHVCLLLASALPVPIRLLPCPLAPLLFTCVRVPRHVVQLCIFICVHVPLHAAHCSPFLYMLGLPCALPLSTHGSPCSDAMHVCTALITLSCACSVRWAVLHPRIAARVCACLYCTMLHSHGVSGFPCC